MSLIRLSIPSLAGQSNVTGSSILDVTFNGSGQSVAGALGETDVVNRVIADLTEHLMKFPR